MGRVIRTEDRTAERRRWLQGIAHTLGAVRDLEPEVESPTQDMFAFLALSLAQLENSVDETAAAWEKRGYWVKADRFRHEWAWVGRFRSGLDAALRSGESARAREIGGELAAAIAALKVRPGRAAPDAWKGAWQVWSRRQRDPER